MTGIAGCDYIFIERTGTNEELVLIEAIGTGTIRCVVMMNHSSGSFITLQLGAKHILQKLAQVINAPGDPVTARLGPDQSGVISPSPSALSTSAANLQLQFATRAQPAGRYGQLGNIHRVTVASGHLDADPPDPPWSQRFAGGDNDTEYHITLDFTQPFLDKLGSTVPKNDCRKIYMVLAPHFEITEQELEDGCFLTAGVGSTDTVWQVDDSSKLSGGRYFIVTPTACSVCAMPPGFAHANHSRAWLPVIGAWYVGSRNPREDALANERLRLRRGAGRYNLEHPGGHRRPRPPSWWCRTAHLGVRWPVEVHRLRVSGSATSSARRPPHAVVHDRHAPPPYWPHLPVRCRHKVDLSTRSLAALLATLPTANSSHSRPTTRSAEPA